MLSHSEPLLIEGPALSLSKLYHFARWYPDLTEYTEYTCFVVVPDPSIWRPPFTERYSKHSLSINMHERSLTFSSLRWPIPKSIIHRRPWSSWQHGVRTLLGVALGSHLSNHTLISKPLPSRHLQPISINHRSSHILLQDGDGLYPIEAPRKSVRGQYWHLITWLQGRLDHVYMKRQMFLASKAWLKLFKCVM